MLRSLQITNPDPDHHREDLVQDPGVIPDLDQEVIILTQVHPILDLEVDLDPDLGLDPDHHPDQEGGQDLDHNQTYQEDEDLHRF